MNEAGHPFKDRTGETRAFSAFRSGLKAGFTLLEVMVVILIIGLLAALTIPSVNKVLRAATLSSSGSHFKDQCVLARQAAQSKNMPVEVRLYKIPGYNSAPTATPEVYRAYQIFLVGDQTNALGKPEFFKSPVIVSAGTNESSVLADETLTGSPHKQTEPGVGDPKLGIYGDNYKYVAFRFLPSGSTDLVDKKNFVTLVLEKDKALTQGGNFYTLQIDEISGTVRSFRP